MFYVISLENQNGEDFVLPYDYQYWFQAFLYNLNNKDFGNFLHNVGYQYENRTFRLFSFSRILEKPKRILRDKKCFQFGKQVSWIISTINNPFTQSLLQSIWKSNYRLGRYNVTVTQLCVLEDMEQTSSVVVRAMSPVTIYSTIALPQGSKRTIYYHPKEKEFSQLICKNLIKKYTAYYQKLPDSSELKVQTLGKVREVVSYYKKFMIKGYLADFQLEGSQELIEMALCTGVGSKNSQGYGCALPLQYIRCEDVQG